MSAVANLFAAVKKNDVVETARLVEAGTPLETLDGRGNGILHYAALIGNVEIARILVDAGIDIEQRNSQFQRTPLHLAAMSGHVAVMNFLLQRGAQINATDMHGFNAFLHAVREGQVLCAHFLYGHGVDVDFTDNEQHTGLHWAAYFGLLHLTMYLLARGADVNSRDNLGCTALHWAASKGHVEIVKLLADHGSPYDAKDNEGLTAWELASRKNHHQVCRTLGRSKYRDNYSTVLTRCASRPRWGRVLFLAPFFFLPLALASLSLLPWWVALPFTTLVVPVLMFRSMYNACTRDDLPNPFFLGYFCCSVLISLVIYMSQVLPGMSCSPHS